MAAKREPFLSPEEYLAIEREAHDKWDRGGKWAQFQRLPSLQEYVLVSQEAMSVERFTRQAGGDWLYSRAEGPDAALSFASLSLSVPLPDVYDRIVFNAKTCATH